LLIEVRRKACNVAFLLFSIPRPGVQNGYLEPGEIRLVAVSHRTEVYMARLNTQDKRLLTSAAGWLGHFGGLIAEGLVERGWPVERVHGLVTEQGREDREQLINAVLDALAPKGFLTVDVTAEDLAYELPGWTREPEWREVDGPGRYMLGAEGFLCEGEEHVVGEEMIRRGKAVGISCTYGQLRALQRNWELIPEELRGKVYFIAVDAIVRHSGGYRHVAYLHTDGNLYWYWLAFCFGRHVRLVRARKVS
jgi:hypothetical protein